jgi:hypothetical protein
MPPRPLAADQRHDVEPREGVESLMENLAIAFSDTKGLCKIILKNPRSAT